MNVCEHIRCGSFPCEDVRKDGYSIPDVELDPLKISIVLISEAAPENRQDYYYMDGEPLFHRTTLQAFQDAGAHVYTFQDILNLGVYLTSAVKCAKIGYGIKTAAIEECSRILEKELRLFANIKAYLLMGDVAIKALNFIARRAGDPRVIPSGSTYKIRSQHFHYRGAAAFPSYLQAGPSFFIEKSKRKMIAEDIAHALELAG
jgi:hypothetical protein